MSARKPLPRRRNNWTMRGEADGHKLYVAVGEYEDGTPGEIFLSNNKIGSMGRAYMEGFGIAASLALQHGCPVDVLCHSLEGQPDGPLKFVVERLKETYLK